MKILQVYKTYLPESFEGVARVMFELASGGPAYGDEHRVLTLSPQPALLPIDLGSHTVFQARQQLSVASSSFSIAAGPIFRELWDWCDLVHFHYPWPMMDLLYLFEPHRRTKPAIVTYHSDVVRQKLLGVMYAPLRRWFLTQADRIVATSPNYLQTSPELARFRSKAEVIPIGLGARSQPPPALLAKWRARFPQPFFLFVGAGRYYKGLPFLFEAAATTGLPVVLAGAIDPAAPGLKVPPNLTLVGPVEEADKEALLELCLALVLPSHLRSEAYGVVLVEASRAGKPMITCEIGTGTTYVNQAGTTGLVVPPADPAAIGRAMEKLASDPVSAAQLGAAARQNYLSSLTAELMTSRYAALYRRVGASRA